MKTVAAFFLSIILSICFALDIPCYPMGEKVDMDKFTITFDEEFEGELDRSVWSGHYQYGNSTVSRKGSYWNQYLAQTEEGKLVIPVVYLEEGMGGEGAGWYSAGIDTDADSPNGFSQKYGYFECCCILPKGADIWSAFWLMNSGVFDEDGNGRDGTEIDIFESDCYGDLFENAVTSNLHFDGYGDAHQKLGARQFLLCNNPYEEFNTYGLEWNENEYIFYINGVETFRTDFGGVSQNEDYVILSVEMKGEDGLPSQRENAPADSAEFIVDYVKVYQYKDLAK
ncbi:MAG: glycoside hydrolase family 16 protein [Acutalibacteraceae bacterium]|nr:glycoside hydrolase family 16 protein [Acutalibacteraceae bacterium]